MSNGDDAGLKRSDELSKLVAAGTPVVTITGPAGVGKSAVVRRWLATLNADAAGDAAAAPDVVHVHARRLPPERGDLEDAILASLSAARRSALGESLGHQLRLAAQRHLTDAEGMLRRAHDTRTLAFWHANKGNLDYELGNHRVAEDHLRDALVLCAELDEAWLGILTTANLASLLAETDRPKEAVMQLELAIAGAKTLGDKRLEGRYLAMLAAIHFLLGQTGSGQMFLEQAGQAIPADTDPGILAAIALHHAHDRLHRLRTLAPRLGERQRDELSAAVADDIRTAIASQQASSDDLRFAARYFLRDAASDTLIVDVQRSWFMHGPSLMVTLETRHTTQRLFQLLIEQHLRAPGTALGHAELIAEGWPGEAIDDEAARNRLKVAMSQLRKLGLGTALKGAPGAYGLAAELRVISVEFAEPQR